ncbi:MAG: thymidylate synthase [Candidatus Parcubacteria bacterium]|nr:thymidylate synthase [Candidatus Parcubacteria bacterium]
MANWPIYFKDKLILGNPDSEIGIVTLWTPVNKIVDQLDKSFFSLAGQLYSKEGINYIVRNILANPRIRLLIICGEERIGSGQALINLLEKGVAENNQVLETEFCQIHKEIPKEAINHFRQNVKYKNLIGVYDSPKIIEEIKNYQPGLGHGGPQNKNWSEPQIFPETKIEFDGVLPTDQSVFKIRKQFAGQAWLEIIKKIMKFGTIRESFHGNNCKELFNIAIVITDEDPENFKMFPYFQITKEDIKSYLPKFMTSDKGTADYTYGERLWDFPKIAGQNLKYNQVDEIIVDFLKRYPTDRAACAVTFGIQDHTAKSSPCMCFLQATNVEDKLDLTAYFRSHDIFGGWLLNAFGLRTLQKYIADKLNWPIGNLTIYSNCAHIYDNNWPIAQEIIKKYGHELDCTSDPRGYIILTVEADEIVAKHVSPNGKSLQEFRQNGREDKATMKLYNKLVLADIISLIPHAFDLGAEIQKAEIAIKQGLSYTQDQPLKF